MDPIEVMVNKHHNEQRAAAKNERMHKHLKAVYIASAVAVSCLLFTLIGLVHPGLAMPLMVIAIMYGCYHLGRCVRFGMRVR